MRYIKSHLPALAAGLGLLFMLFWLTAQLIQSHRQDAALADLSARLTDIEAAQASQAAEQVRDLDALRAELLAELELPRWTSHCPPRSNAMFYTAVHNLRLLPATSSPSCTARAAASRTPCTTTPTAQPTSA